MKVKGPEKQTANGYGDSGFGRCLLFCGVLCLKRYLNESRFKFFYYSLIQICSSVSIRG